MKKLLWLLCVMASFAPAAVTVRTVRVAGGDYPATLPGLQSAVDYCRTLNSTEPCIVDVQAGQVITGAACHLILDPQPNAQKVIEVRSSRIAEIPVGRRVSLADVAAGLTVTIQNDCGTYPAFGTGAVHIRPELTGSLGSRPAGYYVLRGLDMYFSGNTRNALGALAIGIDVDGATKARAAWQLPFGIVVDRCLMRGQPSASWVLAANTHANQHGVLANGRDILIRDSWIADNNMDGPKVGASSSESHGLQLDNGTMLRVHNSHLDGSITALHGGAWTWIPGLVPTRIEYMGNFLTRDPVTWHWQDFNGADTLDTSLPCRTGSYWQEMYVPNRAYKCVAGSWALTLEVRNNRAWTKNGWEVKNGIGVEFEGNVVRDIPNTGDQSQFGFGLLLNNVDSQDGAFHAVPAWIRARRNRLVSVGQGPTTSWGNVLESYQRIHNVEFSDLLIENMTAPPVSPQQTNGFGDRFIVGGGWQLQISGLSEGLQFRNITALYANTFNGGGMRVQDDGALTIRDAMLTDNILSWATAGQSPLNTFTESCAAFAPLLQGAVGWSNLGYIDTNGRGQVTFDARYGGVACPPQTTRAATFADVRFVNYTAEDGDYRLCTAPGVPAPSCAAASMWATAARNGGPLGADAEQVAYATSGAQAGTYDYAYAEFQLRTVSASAIRYTSYSTAACTGAIVPQAGGPPVAAWNDGGGIDRDRAYLPAALASGVYDVTVTCEHRRKTELLRVL